MKRDVRADADATVLETLLAKEREVETLLLVARGEAEGVAERASERARAIMERARERRQERADAAQRELAETAEAAAGRRLAAMEEQIRHLKTLSDDQILRGARRILAEIFPELAEPDR